MAKFQADLTEPALFTVKGSRPDQKVLAFIQSTYRDKGACALCQLLISVAVVVVNDKGIVVQVADSTTELTAEVCAFSYLMLTNSGLRRRYAFVCCCRCPGRHQKGPHYFHWSPSGGCLRLFCCRMQNLREGNDRSAASERHWRRQNAHFCEASEVPVLLFLRLTLAAVPSGLLPLASQLSMSSSARCTPFSSIWASAGNAHSFAK